MVDRGSDSIYATKMNAPGAVVASARQAAGLSMHALAARADVAYSTVSRIEHGRMDPTCGMLAKLLAAAGQELKLSSSPSAAPQLADLVDAWHTDRTGQDRPEWTRLRAFVDHLALNPDQTGPATLRRPEPSGSALMDNLLAAMADKLSDDAGLPRPGWTRRVAALKQPWITEGTPRMQAAAHQSAPEQFLARGIVVRVDSIWRHPETVRA